MITTVEIPEHLIAEMDAGDLAYCTPYGKRRSLPRLGSPYEIPGRVYWQWDDLPEKIVVIAALVEIPAVGYSAHTTLQSHQIILDRGDTLELWMELTRAEIEAHP